MLNTGMHTPFSLRFFCLVRLTGMAIRNTVYLGNVEYSSLRMGAGVGYSMSDASEQATIGEPVLLVLDKEVGVLNSPYIATLDIVAINLAQKRKCDFAITTTDPDGLIDQLPVSITPQQAGSLDSGTRQEIVFKFDALPKDPFDGLKIILTGDVVSEYDLIFATKKLDRNLVSHFLYYDFPLVHKPAFVFLVFVGNFKKHSFFPKF